MQQLQDSVFNIIKTTNLSPSVFSYLQPCEESGVKIPLGGILSDTKHGWLALGPKFCVVDLRTGLKVAARTFGESLSNFHTTITSVVELPTPLTDNSQQLVISLECEDIAGMIVVFHINGSQILKCIQTKVVVTQLAVCDDLTDGPCTCFNGIVMAGTKTGEIFVFDLNRASLLQALKDASEGYENLLRDEENSAELSFLPLNALHQIETQRDLVLENDDHIAILLNENSLVENQFIFRNPDGTARMKANRNHVRVTVLQYIPQLGSIAVGFNFGAFQLWNLMNLELEFTSQVNVECLPVTQIGFQEPCDDPRAFCYLWVVFSVLDPGEEEEFPLAVMYSLTYQGKRMLSDTRCLYQEFLTATIRFQIELSTTDENNQLLGGRCIACHTFSVNYTLGSEEDSMLNICQLVWECWGVNPSATQHGMLLFDLDQWYNDQMPATYNLQSNAFMSVTSGIPLSPGALTLDAHLVPTSVSTYCAAASHQRHLQPSSWRCDCICLTTSEAVALNTIGIQRQIINSIDEIGPTCLLNPKGLYNACFAAGLTPLYVDNIRTEDPEEQRAYLLSVALEGRLSRFLRRCAQDWATGTHGAAGCTLTFLVDWCWKRALELKENARELTAPLFTSSCLPDRNMTRCLEHCVQQLTQLTSLLDAVLTKCCNLVVPDALSEMEERHKGISTVSLYYRVVQWLLRCGLLPERTTATRGLPYPADRLRQANVKRRLKLQRLLDHSLGDEAAAEQSCPLLYIDQLIEHEFGGQRVKELWRRGGSECNGLYPPPSLYSLLRLYLLPDIVEEHKHSLLLYLLVDYSMVYDDLRHEAVIRRLMQFPTMFGLSTTAIKATQAFWHLDHRDFDFALDQLQCLTGNTLSEWQHNVVLSSLLAQKKTQAALQYLHVRKPAPIQNNRNTPNNRVNDHDKLDDWQSCCSLYLARGLVFEALDVIRMCVQNAASIDDKKQVLNFFFKGCRNTGQLAKVLQITMLPFEEEVFIQYLKNSNESQTSDILIMYYLQQARYLEAEQYNNKIKQSKPRNKETTKSMESLVDIMDRETARDTLVEVVCSSLPTIASTVAHCAMEKDFESYIIAPKPMSVYVQASSPKNTFTYKSSFIQDTIGNASETWINRPKARRGLKRALNIEETPFICTPKLNRDRSRKSSTARQRPPPKISMTTFSLLPASSSFPRRSPGRRSIYIPCILIEQSEASTPPKRPRLDFTVTPKTPKNTSVVKLSEKLSAEMSQLLDMPDVQSPDLRIYERAETPHSILKIRSNEGFGNRVSAPASPVDSRYLGDSDDDMLETASNHTHYSDSTNKHLRFTIPTPTELESSPLRDAGAGQTQAQRTAFQREKEMDVSVESFATPTESRPLSETPSLESPTKRATTEDNIKPRKSYKDSVRARRSFSISANSSLSEDPNTSIESIADIPITLVNPRYSGERRRSTEETLDVTPTETEDSEGTERIREMAPRRRRGIRASGESTPLVNKSCSVTPERQDSPITQLRTVKMTRSRSVTPERQDSPITQLRTVIMTRSRSRTPDVNLSPRSRSRTPDVSPRSSPLAAIPEQPAQEQESAPHPEKSILSAPIPRPVRNRSRSRTPERTDKIAESPRLEAITESPTKVSESPLAPPAGRILRNRSRSRTPERTEKIAESPRLEAITESPTKVSESPPASPAGRSLRSRSRTPEIEIQVEKPSSPRTLRSRAKTPEKIMSPKQDIPRSSKKSLTRIVLEANAAKSIKNLEKELETNVQEKVNEKPESVIECTPMKTLKSVPSLMDVTISPIVCKSILCSSNESLGQSAGNLESKSTEECLGSQPKQVFTMNETCFGKSVLSSYDSTVDTSNVEDDKKIEQISPDIELKSLPAFTLNETCYGKSVLRSYQSSVGEDTTTEEIVDKSLDKKIEQSTPNVELKSLTAITLNETCFGKSVLHSYQSSVGEDTSTEEIVDKSLDKKNEKSSPDVELKSLPAITPSETSFGKSVLHSYQSIVSEDTSTEEIVDKSKVEQKTIAKPSPGLTTLNLTNFNKSDSSKNAEKSSKEDYRAEASTSKAKDVSSLMTSDSDIDMPDWQSKVECQAAVIQKEKAKIVEIEREINEIEGEMSDEDNDEEESGDESNDETGDETEEDSSEDEEIIAAESDSDSSTNLSQAAGSDEVISIADSGEAEDDSSISSGTLQIDERSSSASRETQTVPITVEHKHIETTSEINIETIDEQTSAMDNIEETGSLDPLNQAQVSLMTDDNSMLESDQSDVKLNYSDENKDGGKTAAEKTQFEIPMEIEQSILKPQITVEVTMIENKSTEINKAVTNLIEDAPKKESPFSPKDVVDCVPLKSNEGINSEKSGKSQAKGEKEKVESKTKSTKTDDEKIKTKTKSTNDDEKIEIKTKSNKADDEKLETKTKSHKDEQRLESKTKSNKDDDENIESQTESTNDDKKLERKIKSKDIEEQLKCKTRSITEAEVTLKDNPTPRTKKRTRSTTSNKSNKGSETEPFEIEMGAPKTPTTRKRSQSIASNKSTEQKTSEKEKTEEVVTPSKSRAKTPSSEVRKILTRRASKELSEKMDESQVMDESALPPRRRSSRARSINADDDASIASGSSRRSTRSKASEEAGYLMQSARKGRKSIIPTKPDLSVIPELTAEESGSRIEASEDIMNEYSTSRRLTRNQKKVLKSWLEPSPSRQKPSSRTTSVVSLASLDDDASSTRSSVAFDVQPIDRISLLNKGDFDGSPDPSEFPSNASPESIASDASKQRRLLRTKRAMSETKATPKAARPATRRVSVGVVSTPEADSPATLGARGRRASFTRACEALHTPKGTPKRPASTDLKQDSRGNSPVQSSEASATPSRRSRRGSTASSASQNKPEPSASKRSRTMSSVEESKDTKK